MSAHTRRNSTKVVSLSRVKRSRECSDLVLTPDVFRRLDAIAKGRGLVLQVRPVADMESAWARVGLLVQGVYRDIRESQLRGFETTVIEITPRISMKDFLASRRPELDLRAVSREQIWDYLIWHEIGHAEDNFDQLAVQLDRDEQVLNDRQRWQTALSNINEVLADRFAWNKISGGQPVPTCKGGVSAMFTRDWIEALSTRCQRRRIQRDAFPTEPYLCVPWRHLRHGIPYESAADRDAAAKELAGYRLQGISDLLNKAAAAGVRMDAERVTPTLTWSSEMGERVQLMHSLKSELEILDGYLASSIAKRIPASGGCMGGQRL